MRPIGSKAELEARRRRAVQLVAEGRTHAEVSRLVGATPSTVTKWWKRFEAGGTDALRSKRHPGRKPLLACGEWARLAQRLLEGPEAHGFSTGLWTCERVAKVIRRDFGVTMHPTTVLRLLGRMGWSAQKPKRWARERDEAAVETWRRVTWPHIKKGGR